jgi:DNA-binding transcriptional ArsR family regulator
MIAGAGYEQRSGSLLWEIGTGYELFISLTVLHEPETYGLRPSWAAGIRSRIPLVDRRLLEDTLPFLPVPLLWLRQLPGQKDAASVLWAMRQISAGERIKTVFSIAEWDQLDSKTLLKIMEKQAWDENDYQAVLAGMCTEEKPGQNPDSIKIFLDLLAKPAQLGDAYLAALQAFYQVFFAEEEKRIAPILEAGLANAIRLSHSLGLQELLTELSRGVHVQPLGDGDVILVPAYWSTPLLMHADIHRDEKTTYIFVFGVRPDNMSIIPGEIVPEGLLRTLKALADPTRLKILHYLSREELMPSELARRLHLRAPTVTHHLAELRLAGLVNLELAGQEKRYTARREALPALLNTLEDFLNNEASTPQIETSEKEDQEYAR